MRNYDRYLRRASRWLASGKKTKVINFLVPKVPLYLENSSYYAILGRAYLESGLSDEARTYLNRGLQTDPQNLDIRLILAVNHLKRKNLSAAVRMWLEILEEYPGNKYAAKGLETLKKITNEEDEEKFFGRFHPGIFLPRLASPWPKFLLAGFFVIAIILLLYYRPVIWDGIKRIAAFPETRPGTENILSMDRKYLTTETTETPAIYPMTPKEITQALKKAVMHYEKYEDNSARFEINKIRYAQPSKELLLRAEELMELFSEPDIDSLETDYSYSQVSETPELFENCWVLWQGMAANISISDNTIQFDFLVGFDKGAVLEGKVSVHVPFLAVMEPLPLEILSKVELDDGGFRLVAKTLHFLR